MTQQNADTIESETDAGRAHIEAVDQRLDAQQHERPDDAVRPVRYLWPALMSLWQGN